MSLCVSVTMTATVSPPKRRRNSSLHPPPLVSASVCLFFILSFFYLWHSVNDSRQKFKQRKWVTHESIIHFKSIKRKKERKMCIIVRWMAKPNQNKESECWRRRRLRWRRWRWHIFFSYSNISGLGCISALRSLETWTAKRRIKEKSKCSARKDKWSTNGTDFSSHS